VIAAAVATPGSAHSGGLSAEGCHTNRKTGEYPCHRGGSAAPAPLSAPLNLFSGDQSSSQTAPQREPPAEPLLEGETPATDLTSIGTTTASVVSKARDTNLQDIQLHLARLRTEADEMGLRGWPAEACYGFPKPTNCLIGPTSCGDVASISLPRVRPSSEKKSLA